MKKTILIILSFFALTSCDDGDVDVASFNFDSATPQACNLGASNNFFLYSVTGNRAIILQIPETNFNNQLTTIAPPLPINTVNKVIYREYMDIIGLTNICGFPTDANINLAKQWNGVGGSVNIKTTLPISENETDGSSSYANYNHTITLVDAAFDTGSGTQRNDLITLGVYSKPNLNKFDAGFVGIIDLKKCGTNNTFTYKFSGNQSITLNVDNSIFDTSTSQLDIPKTTLINGTTNKVVFSTYDTSNILLTNGYFCAPTSATSPPITENWISENGTPTTGIIEVVSSTIPGTPVTYKHIIRLKKVFLKRGTQRFCLGNNYFFGNIE